MSTIAWIITVLIAVTAICVKCRATVPALVCAIAAFGLFMVTPTGPTTVNTVSGWFENHEPAAGIHEAESQ